MAAYLPDQWRLMRNSTLPTLATCHLHLSPRPQDDFHFSDAIRARNTTTCLSNNIVIKIAQVRIPNAYL